MLFNDNIGTDYSKPMNMLYRKQLLQHYGRP